MGLIAGTDRVEAPVVAPVIETPEAVQPVAPPQGYVQYQQQVGWESAGQAGPMQRRW